MYWLAVCRVQVQTLARQFYDLKSFGCHFGTFCRNVGPKDATTYVNVPCNVKDYQGT